MSELVLPAQLRTRLRNWAREGYPQESCGLMVGRQNGERVQVHEVVRARNLNFARAHDRYELDPEDYLATERMARGAGLEIVGVWHSHPDHPAQPSETDRAAAWQGWSYLIASVNPEGVSDLRCWRLRGEQFEEEPIRP
jgi:proteasome lid subunit RPN8/RPN11